MNPSYNTHHLTTLPVSPYASASNIHETLGGQPTPINYAHHIQLPSEEGAEGTKLASSPLRTMLSEEIKAEGEYLSFRINVIDANDSSQNPSQNSSQIHGDNEEEEAVVIAQGSVALWVMVEDSCNIVRREVDLVASVSGS